MEYHHEESMADDENKEIFVVARAKGVGKENKYKKSWNDEEEERQEKNYFSQKGSNILLHVASLEDRVVGSESSGQGDDGCED
jgi:hypothetical protein